MNAVTRSQVLLVSAHAARLAVSIVVASLLGRNLQAADFAFVALLTVLCIVAVEVLDLGTTATATREVAANPAREREILASLLSLRRLVAVGLFAAILVLAASGYASQPDQRAVLALAAAGVFLLHLHAYQLVFQLRQAYRPVAGLSISAQVGFLAACVVALEFGAAGAAIGVLVLVREACLALGARALAIRKLGARLRASWNDAGMAPLFRAAWMIGVAGLAYKLCTHAGSFILWAAAAPGQLASFNAAQRLLLPLGDLAWLFATPLLAAMSTAAARNLAALRVQLDGHVKLVAGMALVVAVAGAFVAPFVLALIYGEVYAEGSLSAVFPFRALAAGYLFALAAPVLVVGEMVQGHARALLATAGAVLAANLAMNAWAIPAHGAAGASIVVAASEAIFFAILLARAVGRGDVRLDSAWAIYLVPGAVLAALLWLLAGHGAWQLAIAAAWALASLVALMRLPSQKACRATLAPSSVAPAGQGNAR